MNTQSTIVLFLWPLLAFSQQMTGAQVLSFGNLTSVITDEAALFNNQAGLARVNERSFLAGIEQRYFWSGVLKAGAGLVIPTASGQFGIGVQSFGFTEYREHEVGLMYARHLGQALRVGGQLDYFLLSIPGYGHTSAFSFEIGIQADLSEELMIATHLAHPHQIITGETDALPAIICTGLLYKASEKAAVGIEVEKHLDHALQLKLGITYHPVDRLTILLGSTNPPANFHFGFGLLLNRDVSIDLGNRYDPSFGLTTAMSISYKQLEK